MRPGRKSGRPLFPHLISVSAGLALLLAAALALTAFTAPRGGRQGAANPSRARVRSSCKIRAELSPACGAYWGAHSFRGWKAFETLIGRKLALFGEYSPWATLFPTASETEAAAQGSLLYVDWSLGGSTLTWAEVAAGEGDAQIKAEAAALKSFRKPIMVSFESEMDQPRLAAYGTAKQFVAAWRHIHRMFASEGVKNVIWVWDVTGDVQHGPEITKLYPGNAYVNWIMWDAYNWYGCKGEGSKWRSFSQITAPMYEWLTKNSGKNGNGRYLSKPWGLGEYGTVEGATPTAKEQWLESVVPDLKKEFPRLKAAIYLDTDDTTAGRMCNWRVDSSKASLDGFRSAGQASYVATMPFPHDSKRLK